MDVGIEERQVGIDERTNVMVIIETCVAARKESVPSHVTATILLSVYLSST